MNRPPLSRQRRVCQPAGVPGPVAWVHAFVDVPAEHAQVTRAFWSAVTGWPPGEAEPGHPEFTSLTPPTRAPYLHVQTIDGAPRVHLDLLGDLDADPARLERLGATRAYRGSHLAERMHRPDDHDGARHRSSRMGHHHLERQSNSDHQQNRW